MVLLLKGEHKKLWDIIARSLQRIGKFEESTREKIKGFRKGYGTVLFFEDTKMTGVLKAMFPGTSYAVKFDEFMAHTTGMHQLATWTALEEAGFGSNLQHYNPLMDEEVKNTWGSPEEWVLNAQMVFGKIESPAGERKAHTFQVGMADKLRVFGREESDAEGIQTVMAHGNVVVDLTD